MCRLVKSSWLSQKGCIQSEVCQKNTKHYDSRAFSNHYSAEQNRNNLTNI